MVLVALYYVLPLDRLFDVNVVVVLVVGVALLAGMIAWQVRAIERSTYPGIRAVQSLASTTPLFLLLFASTYYVLSLGDPETFTEPLTRTDALYLNGVYEGVLEEILSVQRFLPRRFALCSIKAFAQPRI